MCNTHFLNEHKAQRIHSCWLLEAMVQSVSHSPGYNPQVQVYLFFELYIPPFFILLLKVSEWFHCLKCHWGMLQLPACTQTEISELTTLMAVVNWGGGCVRIVLLFSLL